MSITGQSTGKRYVVKLVDETGDTYYETDFSFIRRQEFIKRWSEDTLTYKHLVGDVSVFVKASGEELWTYELKQ